MFGLKIVKEKEYETLLVEHAALSRVLEEWEQLGRTIRKFADGKVTLGEITGRLNLLQTRKYKPILPSDRTVGHSR